MSKRKDAENNISNQYDCKNVNVSGSLAAQDSKTRKLRGYLDAQKRALLKGGPPTKTAASLEAMLYDKSKKRKNCTATSIGSKSKKTRQSKTIHQNLNLREPTTSNKSNQYQSIWSNVNLNHTNTERNNGVSSVGLLDDLLVVAPIRKKSPSIKSQAKRLPKTNKSSTKIPAGKLASHLCSIGARDKPTQSSDKNAGVEGEKSLLSSRLLMSLPNSKKKSLILQRRTNTRTPTLIKSQTNYKTNVDKYHHHPSTPSSTSDSIDLPSSTSSGPLTRWQGEPLNDDSPPKVVRKNDSQLKIRITEVPSPQTMKGEKSNSLKTDSLPKTVAQNALTKENLHTNSSKTKKRIVNNDNFVRLNMKNTAGACKGARSLKQHNRMKRRRAEWKLRTGRLGIEENIDNREATKSNYPRGKRSTSIHAAIDPLDDYLDGTFHVIDTHKGMPDKEDSASSKCPSCPRHQKPCKLLIVKKNTSGNKGRKFYACSLPQGEQCDFFQWEDDTLEATQKELLNSSSSSGFIARQVAAHVDRLKALTLPELRLEAKKRGLAHTGKKKPILARLSVWVRDEVSGALGTEDEKNAPVKDNGVNELDEELCTIDTDSLSCERDGESDLSEDELEICELKANDFCSTRNPATVGNSDSSEPEPKSSLYKSLKDYFGHTGFRKGQQWAIQRCLSHQKSLLVAPTGQGKSLCYALPAVLMDGVCIVVSPLVSLMEDQLRHLPPSIPAATLSGNLSSKKMATIIDDLLRNRLKILFVSPERLASAAFRRLLRPKYNAETKTFERQLPKVSLLCVDEAHCLSQWGHNFRVSYLRLRSLVCKLDPESVLALTATAGPPVIDDICRTLNIPKTFREDASGTVPENKRCKGSEVKDGTKILSSNRDNIDVAVKFVNSEEARLNLLFKLLRPQTKDSMDTTEDDKNNPTRNGILSNGSVIIYVWRQKDAEVISEQLKGLDIHGGIVCYHGGMDSNARTKSQGKFMRGKARICVATVAFGLGINKADVRGVIHLCLPPSPEHYLQEIGRAGRDGSPARAIALVLEDEVSHKLSLSFSDRISRIQINSLLLNMKHLAEEFLAMQKCSDSTKISRLDLALPISPLVQATDCKEESIQTILSVLEDVSPSCGKLLDIEGIIPDIVIITLKKRSLEKLALQEEIAKHILHCGVNLDTQSSQKTRVQQESPFQNNVIEYGGTASEKGFLAYSFGNFEFSVVKCAKLLGPDAEPRHVYAALRRLQASGELELKFNNTGKSIHIRLNEEGIIFFTEEKTSHLDNLTKYLCQHFEVQDERRADKVLEMFHILSKVSNVHEDKISSDLKKSKRLETFQGLIHEHFDGKSHHSHQKSKNEFKIGVGTMEGCKPHIRIMIASDVNNLLQHPSLKKAALGFPHKAQFGGPSFEDYTALVVTKILHGIETPRAPVLEWFRYPLWGKWRVIHFNSLKEYVKTLLIDA